MKILETRFILRVFPMSLIAWSLIGNPTWLVSDCVGTAVLMQSHGVSMRRSFSRYFADSLMVVYFAGSGMVPNGIHSCIKASLLTISMHVDAI